MVKKKPKTNGRVFRSGTTGQNNNVSSIPGTAESEDPRRKLRDRAQLAAAKKPIQNGKAGTQSRPNPVPVSNSSSKKLHLARLKPSNGAGPSRSSRARTTQKPIYRRSPSSSSLSSASSTGSTSSSEYEEEEVVTKKKQPQKTREAKKIYLDIYTNRRKPQQLRKETSEYLNNLFYSKLAASQPPYIQDDEIEKAVEDTGETTKLIRRWYKTKRKNLKRKVLDSINGTGPMSRKTLSPEQKQILVKAFKKNPNPSVEEKHMLSDQTKIDYRNIKLWFCVERRAAFCRNETKKRREERAKQKALNKKTNPIQNNRRKKLATTKKNAK